VDYSRELAGAPCAMYDPKIRENARARFNWERNLLPMVRQLDKAEEFVAPA